MSMKIGSVRDVLEWAKGRNPEETYNYYSYDDCALARYARDRGVEYAGACDLGYDIERIVNNAGEKSSRVKMSELVETLQAVLEEEKNAYNS